MANLRQVSTSEQVDREAESIKRFLESEKEPVIIAWGTKEGMESYQEARGYEIYGELRLEFNTLGVQIQPKVSLVEGNFVNHLGTWLKRLNLEGKRVKITVEEVST